MIEIMSGWDSSGFLYSYCCILCSGRGGRDILNNESECLGIRVINNCSQFQALILERENQGNFNLLEIAYLIYTLIN